MILVNGDILEARFVCFVPNQVGINVRHYGVSGVIGAPTGVDVADYLDGVFESFYKSCISSQATYRGCGVKRLLAVPSAEDIGIANAGIGTGAGDLLPKQTCGLITLRTGLPGRGFRGRVYVPFPAEDDNDTDSTPTAAYITLLTAFGTQLKTVLPMVISVGVTEATLTPLVYHRLLGLGTAITQGTPRDRWASQRRRGDFGAMNLPPF